jgi:hypothetical protein
MWSRTNSFCKTDVEVRPCCLTRICWAGTCNVGSSPNGGSGGCWIKQWDFSWQDDYRYQAVRLAARNEIQMRYLRQLAATPIHTVRQLITLAADDR